MVVQPYKRNGEPKWHIKHTCWTNTLLDVPPYFHIKQSVKISTKLFILCNCNTLHWLNPVTVYVYTRRFIMFSVITNIYNTKTKGPTLMELFTTTRKQKKYFFDNQRCLMCAPWMTRHTSIRYSVLATHTSTDVDTCVART